MLKPGSGPTYHSRINLQLFELQTLNESQTLQTSYEHQTLHGQTTNVRRYRQATNIKHYIQTKYERQLLETSYERQTLNRQTSNIKHYRNATNIKRLRHATNVKCQDIKYHYNIGPFFRYFLLHVIPQISNILHIDLSRCIT